MKNTFVKFTVISLMLLSVVSNIAYAQGGTGNKPDGGTGNAPTTISLDNPFGKVGSSLLDLVYAIVDNIVLPIGGVLAVLAFIWGGFQYVMAQGNPKRIEKANTTLLHAVIGTALILGAYAITSVIGGTLSQLQK
jgi:SNF family Na+-dependent transporter